MRRPVSAVVSSRAVQYPVGPTRRPYHRGGPPATVFLGQGGRRGPPPARAGHGGGPGRGERTGNRFRSGYGGQGRWETRAASAAGPFPAPGGSGGFVKSDADTPSEAASSPGPAGSAFFTNGPLARRVLASGCRPVAG